MPVYTNIGKHARVAPGVAQHFFIASVPDFGVGGIQEPATPNTIVIATDHTFLPLNGFAKIATSKDKNKVEQKATGDAGNLALSCMATVFVPGSKEDIMDMMHQHLNDQSIVLVKDKDCADDAYYQIGCECFPASVSNSSNWTSGTTADNVKGWNITFESSCGLKLYKGVVSVL